MAHGYLGGAHTDDQESGRLIRHIRTCHHSNPRAKCMYWDQKDVLEVVYSCLGPVHKGVLFLSTASTTKSTDKTTAKDGIII